jgi:molybdopterin synthase catalytic subunit
MITLTDQAFDPGAALGAFCAGRAETGAVASFVGLARGGDTTALELEAWPEFTAPEIDKAAKAARRRFALHDVAVIHRIGRIAPGEAIVLVMTAAAHRREAFEACDFLMDYLKSRAPLWKKEHGPDGARWVEPTARDLADARRWDDPPPFTGEGDAEGVEGADEGASALTPPPPSPLRGPLPPLRRGRFGP